MHENRETSEIPAVRIGCRTAGEGLGRTARVFVSEESHRGILPMKHSNKDGTLSAEGAEGRLRLKENALSPDMYPTQSGIARVLRVGECAVRLCWAAIYPREEPDALMSARPDLCGGHWATGVPTAIVIHPRLAKERGISAAGVTFDFPLWLKYPLLNIGG
jgi:hypothetical protein